MQIKISYIILCIVIVLGCYFLIKGKPIFKSGINRIRIGHIVSQSEQGEFKKKEITVKYRLFKSANNLKAPLVVILHGAGGRGSDNISDIDYTKAKFIQILRKQYSPFILIPQCPSDRIWTINPKRPFNNFSLDSIPSSPVLEIVRDLIKMIISENSIDTDRIYIIGHSMGGTGLWELILRNPDLFTAAIPICAASDPSHAYLVKDIHIWAFSGENDPIYSYKETQEMTDSLAKCGGDVKFTVLKGGGHDIEKNVYTDPDVFSWLFSKSKKKHN
jgi:predicted peptidase